MTEETPAAPDHPDTATAVLAARVARLEERLDAFEREAPPPTASPENVASWDRLRATMNRGLSRADAVLRGWFERHPTLAAVGLVTAGVLVAAILD